jgi:hypothetical protein
MMLINSRKNKDCCGSGKENTLPEENNHENN